MDDFLNGDCGLSLGAQCELLQPLHLAIFTREPRGNDIAAQLGPQIGLLQDEWPTLVERPKPVFTFLAGTSSFFSHALSNLSSINDVLRIRSL